MYKQTESKYKNVPMGNGAESIYNVGCYLVSLCNGLNRWGYLFTPESLNEFFKSPNAWVGPTQNYIDVINLHKYHPGMFEGFQQIDPWNDVPGTSQLLKPNTVVVCRVSAVPIGGTGTHFVLLVDIQDGVAVIHDPWAGKTEKITVRWSKYGNILGLRIFNVKPYVNAPTPPVTSPVTDATLLDLTPLCKEPDGTDYRVERFDTVKAKLKAKDQSLLTNKQNIELLNRALKECQDSHGPTPSKVPDWIRRLFGDNV